MDALARLLTGGLYAGTPDPFSDFWYGPVGTGTSTGLRIDVESAQKVSAWFRGRDILATTLAMLPFGMYERLPGDQGRDDALQHPLHDVLHRKPNPWQDSFQWRRQAMYKLVDHGNSYHAIREGRRGFADELWPIDPTCVTPRLLDVGRKVFDIRDPTSGTSKTFGQDTIFHLMGPSDDGIVGKGILARARDSLGLSLALEGYAATTFSRGAMHGGVIKIPGILNDEAGRRMAGSFKEKTGGAKNWHMPVILEQGSEWTPNTMTPEEAQMLLSRQFSVTDMARWLGLPPHMLGALERSTNNNIEHQGQEFVTYAEGPWLSLWEFATNDQLVLQPQRYYAEFNRDALVRGDLATRWAAHVDQVQTGVYTRNEVRVMNNKKKLPGLDEPLDPAFLTGKKQSGATVQKKGGSPREDDEKAQAIVQQAAARVLRKEIKAVSALAVRHAADADAFAVAVTAFYTAHAALVADTLQMSQAEAEGYCAGQAAQVVAGEWVAAVESWGTDAYAGGLAEMALESEAAA